jgi:hypothetical protein
MFLEETIALALPSFPLPRMSSYVVDGTNIAGFFDFTLDPARFVDHAEKPSEN